jgi:hypothetical protein
MREGARTRPPDFVCTHTSVEVDIRAEAVERAVEHVVARRQGHDEASTEDLRQALVHYRASNPPVNKRKKRR